MTEKTVEKESYRLSEDKRKDLVSGLKETTSEEDNEALSSLAQELERAKRNAEKQEAWISAIVPPSAQSEETPNTGNEIAVEYLLPSEDVFWETYKVKKSYISEDNKFVKLVNHVGYDVNALEYVVGQKVEVIFDKERERWRVDPEIFGEEQDGSEEVETKSIIKYGLMSFIALVLSVPLIILIVRTRGLVLIFLLAVMFVLYLVDNLI